MSLNNSGSFESSLPDDEDDRLERDMLEIKLRSEFGMMDSFIADDIPPELQKMFLQQVYDFEQNSSSGHAFTYAESLSLPAFEPWQEQNLPWEHAEAMVEKVLGCYRDHQLVVIFEFDYPPIVKYKFLTEFLPEQSNFFKVQPGIVTSVTYEDYIPNHIETIETQTHCFMESFFGLDVEGLRDVLWRDQMSLDAGAYDGQRLIEYFENLFASISGFEKYDFIIQQSGYELNFEEDIDSEWQGKEGEFHEGLGYAEGMVGYVANSYLKAEPIRMVGPFKFYFEYREGFWGIMYPQFPGLKIPPEG